MRHFDVLFYVRPSFVRTLVIPLSPPGNQGALLFPLQGQLTNQQPSLAYSRAVLSL